MILLIYGLSLKELYQLLSPGSRIPTFLYALSGAMLVLTTYTGLHLHANVLWLMLPAFLWIAGYTWPGSRQFGLLSFFWLGIPMASFFSLGWVSGEPGYHTLLPVSIIALVWINDIFAYLTGRFLGKHRMTPRLSPGKTWEGFAGGIGITLLTGWLISKVSGTYTPSIWIFCAFAVSLLGMAGDLFESGLKRRFKVKDTGNLLPGHGGILDRFDSLLLVVPFLLIFFLIFHLRP